MPLIRDPSGDHGHADTPFAQSGLATPLRLVDGAEPARVELEVDLPTTAGEVVAEILPDPRSALVDAIQRLATVARRLDYAGFAIAAAPVEEDVAANCDAVCPREAAMLARDLAALEELVDRLEPMARQVARDVGRLTARSRGRARHR